MTALNMDMPFSVSTAENVKETYPDEYQHLRIQSVLAVPVIPWSQGFFVVRNPRRYNTPETSSAMRMFAFVMLSIINDKAAQKIQEMAWSPEDVQSPNDIMKSHRTYNLLRSLIPESLDRDSDKAVKALHNQMYVSCA